MRYYILSFLFIFSLLVACNNEEPPQKAKSMKETGNIGIPVIAIHGGAGNLKKMKLTPEQEAEYNDVMKLALESGYALLKQGKSATEAVAAVVSILEDCPLFNAGKGAVFNHDGINELDAAIMDGNSLDCGAVAGLRRIKNPIQLAKLVMDSSKYVLLMGEGAEEFASDNGVDFVEPSYFFTELRWKQLQEALEEKDMKLDHSGLKGEDPDAEKKFGTVGCVALDIYGNLAAGTSTGGLTNKQYGRVGDSPLIGAGTYANNKTCAVSCTGKGEDFIKLTLARDIASMIEYQGLSLDSATTVAIEKIKDFGGRGGCIAINTKGEISFAFSTTGMFRGYIDSKGVLRTDIYK
jgi:beta-aspartyl-peptidase (threonine type)